MLYALFALILIPVGLTDLGFRLPYDHCWHLDGATLSLFLFWCVCVMMALHLPMILCATIPVEGGCGLRLRPEMSVQDTRTRLPRNAIQQGVAIKLQVADLPTR